MKLSGLLGGYCVIAIASAVATSAQAVFIDFETLSNGDTPVSFTSVAASEYASLGVTFVGGETVDQPKFRAWNSLSTDIADPPINNDWFIGTFSREGPFFDLDILFSVPAVSVSGDVVISPAVSVTVTAYDGLNNVLDISIIPSGASTWIAGSFTFSSSTPINRVHLLPSDPNFSVGLDNLSYDLEPTAVGGSVTGMIPRKIRCEDRETGQRVTIPLPDDGAWNCEDAGLVLDPGDRIRQRVTGIADGTASVGGTATGISGTTARCDNKSTGKWVVIDLNGDNTWDCEEAGLGVRTGDSIVQSVLGTAEQVGPPPDVLTVSIDIKPGDDRNRINLAKDSAVSVAVLTDSEFDALQVDPASVRFVPGEAAASRHRSEDSDGDGDIDLRLRFDLDDTVIACGDTEATLTGATFDGQSITGTDSITVICN